MMAQQDFNDSRYPESFWRANGGDMVCLCCDKKNLWPGDFVDMEFIDFACIRCIKENLNEVSNVRFERAPFVSKQRLLKVWHELSRG